MADVVSKDPKKAKDKMAVASISELSLDIVLASLFSLLVSCH